MNLIYFTVNLCIFVFQIHGLMQSPTYTGNGKYLVESLRRRPFRELLKYKSVDLKDEDDSSCTTKQNVYGICLSIQNCSYAIQNFHRVQLTICTWQGLVPIVCCPKLTASLIANHVGSSSTSSYSPSSQIHINNTTSASQISIRPLLINHFNHIQKNERPMHLPPLYFTRPSHNSDVEHDDPLAFAGESGRPRPSDAVGVVDDNGTMLFTLRGPVKKMPVMSPFDEQRCGLPSYSVANQMIKEHRSRPNSKEPGSLMRTSQIVGGTAAAKGSFPWMAAIFKMSRVGYSFRNTFLCAGSIIDSRHIITAAHCFDKTDRPSIYSVRIGNHNLSAAEGSIFKMQEYTVNTIIFHPDYRPPQVYNDLAILRLNTAITLSSGSDNATPICLPNDAQKLDSNVTNLHGTVTGWGSTGTGGPTTTVLQQITVPLVSNDECNKAYDKVLGMAVYFPHGISDELLCAGYEDGGKDACQGDSGGPLMLFNDDGYWTLIGVVSVGRGCAEPGFPGLYTRITHYISWIKNVTEA